MLHETRCRVTSGNVADHCAAAYTLFLYTTNPMTKSATITSANTKKVESTMALSFRSDMNPYEIVRTHEMYLVWA